MDIVISGASGFIGSALAHSLTLDGHRVVALVRREPSGDEIRWDPAGGQIDSASMEGFDAVVHLAGESIGAKRWTDEQKRRIRDSRVDGTSLLAGAVAGLERPPSVLVSGSAIGVYGDRGDEVLTEKSPAGTGFLADVCVAWEDATAEAEAAGIRVALARTGIVLSREDGALAKQLPFFKLGLGGRFGKGNQWMSWISIDDQVAALRHLIDHEVHGPVNLVAPNPVTSATFASVLGSVLRRPTLLPIPSFGPKLLYGGELVEEMLLSSADIRPSVLEESGFTFTHPELEEALRDLLDRPGLVA